MVPGRSVLIWDSVEVRWRRCMLMELRIWGRVRGCSRVAWLCCDIVHWREREDTNISAFK